MGPVKRGRPLITFLLFSAVAASAQANTITSVVNWGTVDSGCTWEHATCVPDPAFSPLVSGYRAGGSVAWSFVFDRSPFTSIASIDLDVMVVGFWQAYPGNVDPGLGQLGNYLELDGVPYAPFLNMTDMRDLRTFGLPTTLGAGPHTLRVVAYDPYGAYSWLEGWAGVDYATLTVVGESSPGVIPEPASLLLLGTGLVGLRAWRQRRE